MRLYEAIRRIHRRIVHLRLRPIRVFCLHQVSPCFDPLRCYECDWLSTEQFTHSINEMRRYYTFISLTDAKQKIENDYIRTKRYAVLTFDDGYRSNLQVFKWLDSIHIPYTLFLNGKYLDGKSCSAHLLDNATRIRPSITETELAQDLYLTREDILELTDNQVGSHGYEHIDATLLNSSDLLDLVKQNIETLESNKVLTIPFHAYTWGRSNPLTNELLSRIGIIPVLMDGEKNYNDATVIHRELFPGA